VRVITLALLCFAFAFGAWAQGAPIVELSGQYQMLRVNSNRDFPAFTANGGTGSVAVNFFDYVSGVLEVGMVHNGDIQNYQVNNNWLSYLAGPRFSLRNRSRKIIPALECLVGGTTVFASGTPIGTNGATLSANTTGFAMALGGTLDIRLNKSIAFRPIQLDYMLTRINNSYNQNNLRYGAGILFTFGKQ
jgi:hypothetical protein